MISASVIVALIAACVVLWLVNAFLPPPIRTVITIVVVGALVIWLLSVFGLVRLGR